jgi:hypothetical protein
MKGHSRKEPPLKERMRDLKYARKYLAAAKAAGDEKAFNAAARVLRTIIRGARERELIARHLLIHQEQIPKAKRSEIKALEEFVGRRGWRCLWGHDNRMYRILRDAAERFVSSKHGISSVREGPKLRRLRRRSLL